MRDIRAFARRIAPEIKPRRIILFGSRLLALAGAIALLTGCADSPTTQQTSGASGKAGTTGEPCFVIWHMPGNAASSPAGLEVAIWPDGAFLAAADRLNPGGGILVGMVETDDLAAALARVRDAGFFGDWESIVVVDAASTCIRVQDGERNRVLGWTESLIPGVGGDVGADVTYRRFVRMWRRTRAAIDGIAPVSCAPLEVKCGPQGSFRGYRVDKPWETTWMR